ncbi:MAG: TonB-dependent receptor [Sphingobium sp.]
MKGKTSHILLLGSTMLCSTTALHAQSNHAATSPATPDTDIVVTAQRREERLQDVPISITAISGNSVLQRGLNNTEALTAGVPSLVYTRQGNGATPFVRGIGNSSGQLGQEATVATYIDGVYISTPIAGLFNFNNIERIEVLKGPQGTLFGRNATGGVIQIITRKPSADPYVDASVGYGNYDTFSGSLYATTGLAEGLAIDFAAIGSDQRDGWGKLLTSGKDAFKERSYSFRSKLLWEAGDDTTITLAGEYSYLRTSIGLNYHILPGSFGPNGTTYGGFYNTYVDPQDKILTKQWGVSGKVEHNLGWGQLVSITAYRHADGDFWEDADATGDLIAEAYLNGQVKTFTQEIQLQSPASSPIAWIIGGYYLDDAAAYRPISLQGSSFGAIVDVYGRQTTRSYSAFGQASTDIFEDTGLTLGLRYSKDDREVNGRTDVNGAAGDPVRQKASFDKLTWRVGLDHHFSKNIMAYATYNRGFKSGVFNTLSAADPAVKPEVLDAYEIGLKQELFDRRVRLNLSAFYYDYKDIQVNSQISAGRVLLLNAATARVKGGEADFAFDISPNVTLSGGGAYIDGTYRNFRDAPYYIANPDGTGGNIVAGAGTCPTDAPFTGGGCDASGNRLPRSPKVTFNVALDYKTETPIGLIEANANFYHNGGFKWDPDNRLRQKSYNILNASIGWESSDRQLYARLWTQNLLNEQYYSIALEEGLGDHGSPAPPRTYGIKFGVRFGRQ